MSDPVEITQQANNVQQAGGWPGLIGALAGAAGVLGGLWRIIFGSRAERVEANERAAEIALRAAEHSEERAERADEETASHKRALGTCEEQLREMRRRMDAVEAALEEHAACGPLIASLRSEIELARTFVRSAMGSTPPPRYTGDDVRTAMAAQEDTGP